MNQDQRFKLMNVLLDEAALCHDRGDHEDCRALTIQSTRLRFHEEIERIKQGDKKLLDQFVEMQHSENRDAKMVSRYIIMALMEDKEFLEIYLGCLEGPCAHLFFTNLCFSFDLRAQKPGSGRDMAAAAFPSVRAGMRGSEL